MKKRYKGALWIIGIIIVLLLGVLWFKSFLGSAMNQNKTKVVSKIEKYDYSLDDRDSALFSDEFHHLENILKEKEADEKEYITSLAKLFVIDFYSLSSKLNKYDVGSLEYIYPSKAVMFKEKAMDSVYRNIIDNSDAKRVQELPTVSSITSCDVVEGTYMLDEQEVASYIATISWTYEKDMEYDKEAKITFVKKDYKYYVVDYTPTK